MAAAELRALLRASSQFELSRFARRTQNAEAARSEAVCEVVAQAQAETESEPETESQPEAEPEAVCRVLCAMLPIAAASRCV